MEGKAKLLYCIVDSFT